MEGFRLSSSTSHGQIAPTAPGEIQGQTMSALLAQIDSILRTMPANETEAYMEAKRVVPHLVATESDPLKFLRCVNIMNSQNAAQRIARYWRVRCHLFGERAFRPMTSTSDGALTETDRDFLRTGMLAFLPNDSQGRTVLCVDISRRLDHAPEVRRRVIFYMAHIIAENDLSQTEGFVMLYVISDSYKLDQYSVQAAMDGMQILPFKVNTLHILDLASEKDHVQQFEHTHGFLLSRIPSPLHRYASKQDYAKALAAFGLSRQGLPRSLGGLWSYQLFVQWQNERTRIERKRHPGAAAYLDASGNSVLLVANDEGQEFEADEDKGGDNNLDDYRRLLEEAINQIPEATKEVYLEATRVASKEIHEDEANVDWFLLVEELNCWLAAQRLVRYWQLRAEVFSEYRYHGLNQTGEGALDQKALTTLKSNFVNILPSDSTGSPVIWISTSRLHGTLSDAESVRRCMFYMFSILAENEGSQKDGAVVLWEMNGISALEDGLIKINFLERISECLPIKFKCFHLLIVNGKDADIETAEKIRFGDDVFLHISSSRKQLSVKLEPFGLQHANLPKAIGGDWSVDKFYQWAEYRTRFEWGLPLGHSYAAESTEPFRFPSIRPYAALSDAGKAERKRRMNVIHCRRKRDRVRAETEVLSEHIEELRDEQKELMEENLRLEGLVQSARDCLAAVI